MTVRYLPVSGLFTSFGGRTTVHSVLLRRISSSIAARSAYTSRAKTLINGSRIRRLTKLSPPGTGPTGTAITATKRRTPVASIARRIPRVAVEATGPSLRPRGPTPEIAASLPSSAGRSVSGSVRPGTATTSSAGWFTSNRAGSRTTAVTLCPASSACRTTCSPMRPVAPKTVTFICCLPVELVPARPHPRSLPGCIILRISEDMKRILYDFHMINDLAKDLDVARRRRQLRHAIAGGLCVALWRLAGRDRAGSLRGRGGCSRRVAGPSVQVCASCRLPWGVFESASGSAAREGDEVPVDRSRPPRTSRRAVAAGLLVALGVLVVIGRAERHALTPRPSTPASPPTTTTPPAPLAARIRVGRGVAAVAVGQGGVWALRSRSVVRVDPRTNRVTARIRAPAADSWDGRFALGAGALWVGTGADTIRVDVRTGRPSLVRVDPRTLAETTRIPVPACPAALAAERGLVWAIDEPGRRVLRVDAASAHLTEIGLPVAPFAVSPTGPGLVAVWALSDQVESPTRLGARVGPGLVRIDPTSARVTGVTPLANLDAAGQALAVGAGGVWVLGVPVAPQGGARGSFVLDRVDPRCLAASRSRSWS